MCSCDYWECTCLTSDIRTRESFEIIPKKRRYLLEQEK